MAYANCGVIPAGQRYAEYCNLLYDPEKRIIVYIDGPYQTIQDAK
jgi:hypothetical protein